MTKQKISALKKSVQSYANRYARLRDCYGEMGANCISCNLWFPFEELDGGHFIPTTKAAIRFDERNINAQCHKCNRFLHGNERHYYKGMLKKYGVEIVEELESREFEIKKWTREELIAIREDYKKKIKHLGSSTTPKKTVSDLFA